MNIIVDTDNACGSGRGDVDDAYAIAYLAHQNDHYIRYTTTFGNTSEALSYANTTSILKALHSHSEVYHGPVSPKDSDSEGSEVIGQMDANARVLCLGPLTGLSQAISKYPDCRNHIDEVIFVGGNTASKGFLPPIWPHEFNLTQDREASYSIINDPTISKTMLPLNVAKRLRADTHILSRIPNHISSCLLPESRRWQRRCRYLKLTSTFAVWDLAAAVYAFRPQYFKIRSNIQLSANKLGVVKVINACGKDNVIEDLDADAIWESFLKLPPPRL